MTPIEVKALEHVSTVLKETEMYVLYSAIADAVAAGIKDSNVSMDNLPQWVAAKISNGKEYRQIASNITKSHEWIKTLLLCKQ